jgi:hypothetical protein
MFEAQRIQRLDPCGTWSVGLTHKPTGLVFWMDVEIQEEYKDINVDWNQYIFSLDDSLDCERKALQEDLEAFEEAVSEAVYILEAIKEVMQDESGNWFCTTNEKGWKARVWTTWDLKSMNLI